MYVWMFVNNLVQKLPEIQINNNQFYFRKLQFQISKFYYLARYQVA